MDSRKISKAVEWVEDKNVSVSWSVNPFLNATDEQKSEATHVTENVKSRQAKIHTETAERYVEPAGKLSNADSGSIREISENLTRSLGQLVTAMESASEIGMILRIGIMEVQRKLNARC